MEVKQKKIGQMLKEAQDEIIAIFKRLMAPTVEQATNPTGGYYNNPGIICNFYVWAERNCFSSLKHNIPLYENNEFIMPNTSNLLKASLDYFVRELNETISFMLDNPDGLSQKKLGSVMDKRKQMLNNRFGSIMTMLDSDSQHRLPLTVAIAAEKNDLKWELRQKQAEERKKNQGAHEPECPFGGMMGGLFGMLGMGMVMQQQQPQPESSMKQAEPVQQKALPIREAELVGEIPHPAEKTEAAA